MGLGLMVKLGAAGQPYARAGAASDALQRLRETAPDAVYARAAAAPDAVRMLRETGF
jgi:hypothetical protein